jgi:hypothetical protein
MSDTATKKLYTNGTAEEGEWRMTLEQMQKFVGGYIEQVASNIPHRALIVNEEGFLDNLPQNPQATALVAPGTSVIGHIRGNALLIKA